MNQQTPLNLSTPDCNGIENSTRKHISNSLFTSLRKRFAFGLFVIALAIAPSSQSLLFAQSTTCVPPVDNSNTDQWSEECYLNNTCGLQGNPCQAGDVSLLGVFIADEFGGPVPACEVGEEVTVLLWGTFSNGTNSSRYAVRTRTEIFINGVFFVELIGCSFDVLLPGQTDVALLGTFTYTCGDQIQLVNTWIAWDTNQAQCSDSGAPNYDNVCGEYPPSKCSRNFDTISFLTPNFEYFCGLITSTTTEVCFTDLTLGGNPPYTYLWEFGDNTTSTLQNPCHTYVGTTGSYTVTLTVMDGDSIQAGAILEVDLDSLECCDMTVICPPADGGLFSCIDDIPAANTDLVTVTDSCGPVVITFEDDTTGTGCGTDTMFVVRSYFITDGSNVDTCVQTFAAVDDEGPDLIGCPGDISVECASLVPVQDLDGIDATDNCSGVIFLSLLPDVVSDSTCANRYVITRTFVATDACGNSTTCEQLITVFDDTPPAFTFVPLDSMILCDADTIFGVPLVTDNCGGAVSLDSVTNFFTTVSCAGGSIVRTWTATDACGNTTSADQSLILIDTIDPEFIFVPADTSIACGEVADFGTPVVTDNCDVSVSIDSVVTTAPTVNCAGGTTTIVWTATDNCGNTATANQVITFIDTLDPVFTFIPIDSTIACGATPVFGVPVATDDCDLLVSITADTVTLAGICGDTSIVTWTATDNCGNTSTADQAIFEVDILAPSISCPPDVTLECGASTEPNTSIPGEATATDNCDVTPTVDYSDVTVASQTCILGFTITRTWTATDDCGNSTACVQTIVVDDTVPPTLRCPLDITIECTDSILPDSTGTPVAVDACDATPGVSFSDVTLEGICPQSYLIERTWLAIDTCGNDTTCVQLITVTDSTGPVIVCPADTIVDCTAEVDTAALGVATATDNCGGAIEITFSDVTIAGDCEQEYTINRTWLAVDECLNRTTCVQVISVQDTVPPVFDTILCPTVFEFFTSEGSTCPFESVPSIFINIVQGIPIAVDETWTFGNNIIPSFEGCLTDNCANADSFYILGSSLQLGGDSCDAVLTVVFNVEDNCGNAIDGGVEFTITIHDDVAPVITCPLNVTVDCDASTAPDSTGFATAIDNCIGLVGLTYEDSTAAGACPNEMLIFRTWTADDSCGNTSSCTQLIFVEDNTAPVLTCPASVTVECTDSISPDSTGFPLVVDNCDLTPEVTFLDATIASLTCPQEYSITRTWTAVDTCGNISTCVQFIFVDDSTPPVLTCPANVTIECDESTLPDSTGIATAIDNCDLSPEVTFLDATIAGGCPQAYGIIRVWSAVDTCGNISTCTQLISVVDTTAPVILCPADTIVDCGTDLSSLALGVATATDNCDASVLPTFSDVTIAGACPQEYTITRTWLATDSCFNTSTCIQTITIQDTLGPVISCPADTLIDCTAGTLPGITGRATALDNCDPSVLPTFADVTLAGECPQEYTITRTWTAIDDCLNETTCEQIITVQDTLGPLLVCPPDTVIDCTASTLTDNTGIATATDNCDTLVTPTFVDVTIAGLCPQGYTIERTWTAIDDCLNSSTCVQLISVQDTLEPVLICPADTIIDCTESTATLNLGVAIATDNCDTLVLVNSVDVIVPSTICPTGYTILRTWTAVDDCLNRTTCLQTITVQDTTGPVIVCPADTLIDCNTSISPDSLGTATATDNCDAAVLTTFTDATIAGECPQEYTITRTWVATDSCFNSSTCVQIITVQDTMAPVIVCPDDITIECTDSTLPENTGIATSTDNCDPDPLITFADITIAGECPQEYSIERTWTAADTCGNSSTCVQIILIEDSTPPEIICPEDLTIQCSDSIPALVATATDNCGAVTIPAFTEVVCDNPVMGFTDIYATANWTISVPNGGSVTAMGDEEVMLVSPDESLCPGGASALFSIVVPSTGSITFDWSYSTGDIDGPSYDPFGYNVNGTFYQLTDDGGANVQSGVVSVGVTAGDVFAFEQRSTDCTFGSGATTVVEFFACITQEAEACTQLIVRTHTAVDECGNESSCVQTIFIIDTIAPVLTCPADTIVDCTESTTTLNLGVAIGTDNCDTLVEISNVDVIVPSTICPTGYTILRTWTALDECLNSSTCLQTIIVQDTTAPVIVCPADTLIDCNTSISPDTLGTATATDNCDAAVLTTFLDVTLAGECPQEYTITRTWMATDSCFNSSTCVQIITIQDTLGPVITCPADTLIDCTSDISPESNGFATATDNCDVLVIPTFADVTVAGECPQEYTITRTWTAIDDCLNESTCVQIISVQDTLAPVIVCPADTIIDCTSITLPGSTGRASATDNCDTSLEPTFADVTIAGECPQEYTINRTWTVIDDCLNESSCIQIITVQDTMVPVIVCPADTIIDCTASISADSLGVATATDNCDTLLVPTFTDLVIPGQCPQNYQIIRTWTAVDDCQNSSTCAQLITVQDTTAPVIVCPADTIIDCTASISTDSLGVATATDNCSDVVTPTFADVTIGGQCPQEYTITRTWTAVDSCFNVSTCVQTITVQDTLAPVIVCPADTIIDCATSISTEVLGVATVTDNCDTQVTPTFADVTIAGECPQEYTITRTWTAVDDCFNTSTCVQTITVQDTTAPVIVCPADTVVDCTSGISTEVLGFATATDNCDLLPVITSIDVTVAGDCPQEYTITRTWTAVDACLNSSTCVQTINVQDTLAPVLTCPLNITVECTDSVDPDSTGVALAADNCDISPEVTFMDVTLEGGCPQEYMITRTWTATDSCGNSSSCSQLIFVEDNTPPVITCPTDVTVDCDASILPDSTGFATAIDNCDESPEVTYSDVTFSSESCLQEYFITRLWTATDSCGNSSTCFQSIFVQDTTPPVATFIPPDITVECDTNLQVLLAELPIFEDNCDTMVPAFGSIEVVQNPDCPYTNTYIIGWSGVDDCGNSTTVGRTIVVIDTTAPVIICPADVTLDCLDDTSTETNGFAEATDNCDPEPIITSADITLAGDCPQEYTITRTWTAADACGNSSTCVQTLIVVDTMPPAITCPADLTFECRNEVPAPSTTGVIASDSCGITTVTFVADIVTDSTCVNRLNISRVYQAEDECGNTSTCTQTINVFDDTPPVITCPMNVTVQCAALVPAVNIASVITTDNCGGTPTVTHVGDAVTNMTCANRFTLTRTYRSTDACGNSATCAQVITVFDNTPPVITCPMNVTVQCASQVPAPNIASVTVTDNCAGTSTVTHVGDVITNMTCVNRFTLTRTYRATDACGNSATCAQVITVFDNTAPTITCPANITVQCANQVPAANVALVTTSDNCGGTVTVTVVGDVITNMTCINRFTLTRTYRATDACGNSATCAQVITVFDNTAPTIEFIDPLLEDIANGGTLEVQCFGQDPEWDLPVFGPGSVSTMDNCAGNVTVVVTDELVDEGDCDVDGYINRYRFTWTATDACGNTSSAFIFMELIDTIPPVIQNIPENITVNCNEIPEPPTNIMAADECLCACVIEFEESAPAPGCQDGQVITRTWTAEDDCGNVTVEVQTITLIDEAGPEIVIVFPELEGVENGTIFEYTCNEGGIPEFFEDLSAESVTTIFSCGTAGIVSFEPDIIIANNCKFWGYIESRTYVWEAVDQCGNVSTFTIIVRLVDTEGPQFINIPEMTCVDDPALALVDIIDNCENAKFTYWDTPVPNPCGEGEALRRTYEAWDNCGNYSRDTVILIPNDKSHPTMEFINPDLIGIEFGEFLIVECNIGDNGQYTPYGPDDVAVMDACMGELEVTFTERIIESGNCNDGVVAVMELVWMAMDVCGNRSQLLINAHIVDNTSPELVNFEVDVTIDCDDDMPELFAIDNCGEVTITTVDSIVPGACEFEYDVLRRIILTDACGNTAERKQIVRVGDGQGPLIEGVEEEVCDDLSIPEVTAFDPCAGAFVGVTMQEDTLDVPCRDGFVIERIWTAVDACGNVSEVRQLIIIGDQTPPEIHIPSGSVIRLFDFFGPNHLDMSNEGTFKRLQSLDSNSVTINDDCDQEIIPEFNLDVTISDNCEEDGYYEHRVYTWIATDACGNADSFSFEINIMDDIPPVLSGTPEDTIVVCEDLPAPPVVSADDYADDVTIEYAEVIVPGDGPGVFVVIRTWTATDPCGNVSQTSQNITWIPETLIACDILLPETVDCNTHGVVIGSDVSGGLGGITYMWEITGEKCFIQSGQNTPEITIYVGFSEVEISLTVTDAFGCSNVCTATLDCLDPIVADFTAQQDPTAPQVTEGPSVKGSHDDMIDILQHFNMWPNPAAASVNISFESMIEHETRIVLVNYLGQTVYSKDVRAIKGFNSHKLNVAHLPEGSYMVQLMSERAVESKMLVLVRNK